MADNETFRFLGGLGWTNDFSVHTRIGVCLGVLSGAMTGDSGAILGGPRGCLRHFWASKTNLVKSSKFLAKTNVLGSGGSSMEPKWTPKVHCFLLLKSYEFLVKNSVRGTTPPLQKLTQKRVFIFLAKNVIFHNPWFYLRKTEVSEGQGSFFWGFWGSFFNAFFGPLFSCSFSNFDATYGFASVKQRWPSLFLSEHEQFDFLS